MYYFGEFEQAIAEHEEIDKYFSKRGSREGYGLGRVWVACCRAKLGEVDSAVSELQDHLGLVLRSITPESLKHLLTGRLAQWLPEEEREPAPAKEYGAGT